MLNFQKIKKKFRPPPLKKIINFAHINPTSTFNTLISSTSFTFIF